MCLQARSSLSCQAPFLLLLLVCPCPVCRSVKGYHEQAVAAGIPALTTAGIYPGTSNVMAAHIVSISRGEYDDNWAYRDNPTGGVLQGALPQRGACVPSESL